MRSTHRCLQILCLAALVVALASGTDAAMRPSADAFTRAAGRGDLNQVKRLIAQGARVDSRDTDGYTALMKATFGQHEDLSKNLAMAFDPAFGQPASNVTGREAVIKYLLAHHADPNARAKKGVNPLTCALLDGSPDIARTLIAGGADVNAADSEGISELDLAVIRARLPLVRLLVAHGADINHSTRNGRTPLMFTAVTLSDTPEMPRIAHFLIEHGSVLNARDHAGKTALALAEAFYNDKVAAVLRRAGEKQ